MPKFILIQHGELKASTNSKTYELAKKKFIKHVIKNPSEISLSTHIFEFMIGQTCGCGKEKEAILEFFNGDAELFDYWETHKPKNINKIQNVKFKKHIVEQTFNTALLHEHSNNGGISIINVSEGIKI